MRVFFSPKHKSHSPKTFISKGKILESPEQPKRADILEKAARLAGHDFIEAKRYGLNPIKNISIDTKLDEKDIEESLLELKRRVGAPKITFRRRK